MSPTIAMPPNFAVFLGNKVWVKYYAQVMEGWGTQFKTSALEGLHLVVLGFWSEDNSSLQQSIGIMASLPDNIEETKRASLEEVMKSP